MIRYCLDTSAYSQFKRGHAPVVEAIDSAEWIGVPTVTIGELWSGFLQGTRADANGRALAEFLDHPVVDILCVDEGVARIYAEIVLDLRRKGTPLPANDIWIAATAAQAGAAVLTCDPHFKQIGRVGAVVIEVSG
jgi:predicted nucleic acid-binding protein